MVYPDSEDDFGHERDLEEPEAKGIRTEEPEEQSGAQTTGAAEAHAPTDAPSASSTDVPTTPIQDAVAWVTVTFGVRWKSLFHYTHRLSLAQPLVYCRVCGQHCESPDRIRGLGKQCPGVPDGTNGGGYVTKCKRIAEGLHPRKSRRLLPPAPLPMGTRGEES